MIMGKAFLERRKTAQRVPVLLSEWGYDFQSREKHSVDGSKSPARKPPKKSTQLCRISEPSTVSGFF